MIRFCMTLTMSALIGLAGCVGMNSGGAALPPISSLKDLSKVEDVSLGTEYVLGSSGVCGRLQEDHLLVTRVIDGSPAAGKVKPGDKIRALQYRGIGRSAETIRKIVAKRIFRLGRDWDWHLYLTVERPSLRQGKGNTLTFDLRVPRPTDKTYHFGPTGFFAKIFPDHLLVDHIDKGSPADGSLELNDKIIAVDGRPVIGDVFKLFADCVDRAETQAAGGKLALRVKRAGAEGVTTGELDVDLTLEVLGSYSDSSPIDCPKTDAIITRTADGIIARGKYGRINTSLLALLSTGEKKYIDHVSKVLHEAEWAKPNVELSMYKGKVSWSYAYQTMALCEYYLLTKDDYVLPAIKAYAGIIARGQDAAGLWNHRMANPAANFGKLHGRLYGYAAINQTSVALWISLILAQECGVDDPEVKMAVQKTYSLYSYWIERGKLPYGNHGAGEDFFTNNGTSGSVAVGFALLDEKRGASFFSRMSAAAAEEVLTGHTGPWFNIFWSGIGANVTGPETTKAYNRELHWLRTVTRTWDHRFLHMEARGCKPGGYGLGSSGAFLFNLAAGRRALRVTGRGMDKALWLNAERAQKTVDAGAIDYAEKTTEELLDLLGHSLPPVRLRASEMLAIKDADVAREVVGLLADGSRNQRIGAIHAIASLKIESAVDRLMAIVRDTKDDLWIRQLALRTMILFDGAETYTAELLAMLAADKSWDVQGRFDEDLGRALVRLTDSDPYAAGLDRDLLYKGVKKLLDHKRQNARGAGMALLKQMPLEDLYIVADEMIYVIKDKDRSYVSYHGDGHRQTGLNILYALNIDESLDLTLDTIHEKVGRGWRARNRKRMMKTWGAEAERVIPKIREVLGKEADTYVKIIENAETGRKMISLEEARKRGRKEQNKAIRQPEKEVDNE